MTRLHELGNKKSPQKWVMSQKVGSCRSGCAPIKM